MVITPPPTSSRWWKIGLTSGKVVIVAPDVIPCSAPPGQPGNTPGPGPGVRTVRATPIQADPAYTLMDGRVMKAPGLVGRLTALTAKQGYVNALMVSPSEVSEGVSIRVTGSGWVGPEVRLTLDWSVVGKTGIQERPLAKVPVGPGGAIEWTGRLPADLPASAADLSLSGDDGVRSNAVQLQVQ